MGQRMVFCSRCGSGYIVDERGNSMFCNNCGNRIMISPLPQIGNNVYQANAVYNCIMCGGQNTVVRGSETAKCVFAAR